MNCSCNLVKVLFSHESKVNMINSDGMKFIRHYKNKKFRPSFIRGQLLGGSVMVYGTFRSSRIGLICQLRGRFDSAKYIDLLNTVTRPYCKENMPPRFLC